MIRIDCRSIAGEDIGKSEQIQQAYQSLVRNGCVILDHVLPEATVHALACEFAASSQRFFEDRETHDTLEVGDRRFMVPLSLQGGFGDPMVWANPYVVALARELLDSDAILESFGAVLSLSGAERQHVHRDGPVLFDAAISTVLPAHALTFALPLIEMNDLHGTTALWPGSHRWKAANEQVVPECPTVPVGSCVLWDFRLYHSGTANRSTRHRPIVYGTYARVWYQDPVNFRKDGVYRLVFDRDFVLSQPADRRRLFSHLK